MRRLTGRIKVHPVGYGFVVPDDNSEDVHVAARNRGTAMDGDTVEVDSWVGVRGFEGRVVRVVSRGRAKVTGQLARAGRVVRLQPDDPRITGVVTVAGTAAKPLGSRSWGRRWSRDHALPRDARRSDGGAGAARARRSRRSAHRGREGAGGRRTSRTRSPTRSSASPPACGATVGRRRTADRADLRAVPFTTIDPETARDFDDAVAVEPLPGGGTRLWVAVADVSHYVREGRPSTTRRASGVASIAVGTMGCAVAALFAELDGPVWVVVIASLVLFTTETSLRPLGAVLVPSIVRSSAELITANVRLGQCENASVLVGPLVAAGLLAVGGPSAVMHGCVVLTAFAAATAVPGMRRGPLPTPPDRLAPPEDVTPIRRLARAATSPFHDLAAVARRPGALGVLAVEGGDFLLIGALDILLVVVAGEYLDLGGGGAGILSALFGIGAVGSGVIAGRLARRPRVGTMMVTTVAAIGVGCLAFGASITVVVACIVLPLLGVGRALLNLLARVLLQRSAPPSELPIVFGAVETTAGIGLITGSLLAQVLIAVGGVGTALTGMGVVFLVIAAATIRPLRAADDGADVPVVAMSLLRRLSMFEPLPTAPLEAVARSAVEHRVAAGDVVVRQGDHGDRFYAVADGRFDVSVSGEHIRTIGRGEGFGEIALLADVARTATVTATEPGALLAVEREPFLIAVSGHEAARRAAWAVVPRLQYDGEAPTAGAG